MIKMGVEGVDFIGANTDAQALRKLSVDTIIQLGGELTKGLGAGTNPEVGKQAALEDREHIKEVISGADMIFLTAGMGGGTGTGAIPVIAEIAKELDILTVAVVTKPFKFEGAKKQKVAEQGIEELARYVDSLITVPNQKLMPVLGAEMTLLNAFDTANDVLLDAVQGVTELIVHPGLMNVDFADVKTVMSEMGVAIMGSGSAVGENRAREAADKAIACKLLEDINLQGARGILVNITAGADLGIAEFEEVLEIIHNIASDDALIKVGTAIDPDLDGEIKITVVATGMGGVSAAGMKKAPVTAIRKPNGEVDYNALDKPTIDRVAKSSVPRETRFGAQQKENTDMNFLDIPAFLRRQAD
jgi:cell division protein FtsZ